MHLRGKTHRADPKICQIRWAPGVVRFAPGLEGALRAFRCPGTG